VHTKTNNILIATVNFQVLLNILHAANYSSTIIKYNNLFANVAQISQKYHWHL